MKLHKIEIVAVDFDEYGIADLLNQFKNIDDFLFKITSVESIEPSEEWNDDSPLNKVHTSKEDILKEYERLKSLSK